MNENQPPQPMTIQLHTPGLWTFFEANGAVGVRIDGCTFFPICNNIGAENAARVCECVNALDCVADPFAELKRLRAIEAAARRCLKDSTYATAIEMLVALGERVP